MPDGLPTRDPAIAALEQRLGVPIVDPEVALAALTHKSFVNEHRGEGLLDNERLEFLGDAVIDLAVSHRLMERFPDAREGELSKIRAAVVDEAGLAQIARELDLGPLLRLGRGEELTGGRQKSSLLADTLEAVIAVVYVHGGLAPVLALVDRFLGEAFARATAGTLDRDFKTQLQEMAQSRLRSTPRYRVVAERVEGEPRCGLLRVLLGAARAAPHHLAAQLGLDLERLRMVGPVLRHDPVPRRDPEAALRQLLELRLPVPVQGSRGGAVEGLAEEAIHHHQHRLEAAAEEDRRDHRLHRVREERRLLPATGELLAAPDPQERAEIEGPRHLGEPLLVHHRGAHLRELALARGGEALHEPVGHGEVDDGVAEELEPLVVGDRLAPVLVHERLVGEGGEGEQR